MNVCVCLCACAHVFNASNTNSTKLPSKATQVFPLLPTCISQPHVLEMPTQVELQVPFQKLEQSGSYVQRETDKASGGREARILLLNHQCLKHPEKGYRETGEEQERLGEKRAQSRAGADQKRFRDTERGQKMPRS